MSYGWIGHSTELDSTSFGYLFEIQRYAGAIFAKGIAVTRALKRDNTGRLTVVERIHRFDRIENVFAACTG